MQLTIGEIKNLFPDNTLEVSGDTMISGINRDSRSIKPGEIYAAISGEKYDGHDFIRQAFERGAIAALVDKNEIEGANLIRVGDVIKALGVIAKFYRIKFAQPVIAITGSNGKTTTKEFLSHVLSGFGPVVATQGNLNNHIGVPVTVFRFCKEAKFFVVEMGMNHLGEISYLTDMVIPDMALITSVGRAHLEGVGGTIEAVAQAKGELFSGLNQKATAFVFEDDPFIAVMPTQARRVTYGFSPKSKIFADQIQVQNGGTEFEIHDEGQIFKARIQLIGMQHVQNALSVYAIATSLGLDKKKVIELMGSFSINFNRGRKIEKDGWVIIDDSYNANPDSMVVSLDSFCAEFATDYKVVALGGMRELGEEAPKLHQEIGAYCQKVGVDAVLAYGENAEHYLQGFGAADDQEKMFSDHKKLAEKILELRTTHPKMAVLIKGSRMMTMEKILEFLN